MNKIDLHMHSYYSIDGNLTKQELFDIASESNIKYIAIADHNDTRIYNDNCDQKGINLIPAVELDCTFQGLDFHLLGYGISPYEDIYEEIRNDVTKKEKIAGIERLNIIKGEMGIAIDQAKLDELCPNGVYVAESVCEVALSNKTNADNKYMKEFFPGGRFSESPYVSFFWEYCAKGKIAYYPIEFMSMEEAIAIFRKQNALIVLAHPGNNTKEELSLLDGITNLGIDGIEVYSSYHNNEQIRFYDEYAKKHQLIKTAGSDYHGKSKPNIKMGQCQLDSEDEKILIDLMKKYILKEQ